MGRGNGHLVKLNIQVIILKDSKKVLDSCIFLAAISIREILLRIKDRRTGRCFGLTVHFIREIGKGGFKMERDKYI